MITITNNNKLISLLKRLPTLREEICVDSIKEIRRSIGQGVYLCKLLFQKSSDNKEAIKLFYIIMKSKKIIICRGIPGSGKSFFARSWVLEDSEHRVRFNNDNIRNMLGKYWVPSREDIVKSLYYKFLDSAMSKGYDIIIDNMNLNTKTIDEIRTEVNSFNEGIWDWRYEIEFKDFKTPLEICIERDSKRENPIGKEVIINTYNRYKSFYEEKSNNC